MLFFSEISCFGVPAPKQARLVAEKTFFKLDSVHFFRKSKVLGFYYHYLSAYEAAKVLSDNGFDKD
ncbi:MAG: hypothetical protein KGY69_07690 [Bacteroidales bacterium]|nr:hypothetical protein [Bacteroidales bacterium]